MIPYYFHDPPELKVPRRIKTKIFSPWKILKLVSWRPSLVGWKILTPYRPNKVPNSPQPCAFRMA